MTLANDRRPSSGEPTSLPAALANQLFDVWLDEDRAAAGRALDDLCARHPSHAAELHRVANRLDFASGECSKVVAIETPRPPARIGPYRIVRALGRGGFGVVWLAEQIEPLRRQVAVKVLHASLRGAKVLRRFEVERDTLAQMRHPSIANILDAGVTDGGEPYFVMEYVPGVPITRYCDENKLTVDERLELFLQVCAAVQHAHQSGVIHRDLKPANVLVCDQDGPLAKVIDFGLAKALGSSISTEINLTEEGRFVGTPEYMSPEQAGGGPVDTRADVYALGVLLYELLTDELPIDSKALRSGGWGAMLQVLREREPLRPSQALRCSASGVDKVAALRKTGGVDLLRRVRGDLEWITMTALAKARDQRYPTVVDLAADVRRHLQDRPVSVGPPSSLYVLRKFARRHRIAVVASAVVATLTIWAIAEVISARYAAERRRADAEYNAYAAHIAVAKAALDMRRTRPMREALLRARAELRGWEWRYLASRMDQSLAVFPGPRGPSCGPVLVDRGKTFVASHEIGNWPQIEARSVETGKVRYSFRGAAYEVFDLSSSADGNYLAVCYTRPAQVHLHDGVTGKPILWDNDGAPRPAIIALERTHATATFQRQSNLLAVAAKDRIRLFDPVTGKERSTPKPMRRPGHDIQDLRFTTDGSRLISVRRRARVPTRWPSTALDVV